MSDTLDIGVTPPDNFHAYLYLLSVLNILCSYSMRQMVFGHITNISTTFKTSQQDSSYNSHFQYSRFSVEGKTIEERFIDSFVERWLMKKFICALNINYQPVLHLCSSSLKSLPSNEGKNFYSSNEDVFKILLISNNKINYDSLQEWKDNDNLDSLFSHKHYIEYIMDENTIEDLCSDMIAVRKYSLTSNLSNDFLHFNKYIDLNESFKQYREKQAIEACFYSENNEAEQLLVSNTISRILSADDKPSRFNKSKVYNICHHILKKVDSNFKKLSNRQTFFMESNDKTNKLVVKIVVPKINQNEASFFEILFEYLLSKTIGNYKDLFLNGYSISDPDYKQIYNELLSEFSIKIRTFKPHSATGPSIGILTLERKLDVHEDIEREHIYNILLLKKIENTKLLFKESLSSFKELKIFTSEGYIYPGVLEMIQSQLGHLSSTLKFHLAFSRYVYSNRNREQDSFNLETETFKDLSRSLEKVQKKIGGYDNILFVKLRRIIKDESTTNKIAHSKTILKCLGRTSQAASSLFGSIKNCMSAMEPALNMVDSIFSNLGSDSIMNTYTQLKYSTTDIDWNCLQSEHRYTYDLHDTIEERMKLINSKKDNDSIIQLNEEQHLEFSAKKRIENDLNKSALDLEKRFIEEQIAFDEQIKFELQIENTLLGMVNFSAFNILYNILIKDSNLVKPDSLEYSFSLSDNAVKGVFVFDLEFKTKFVDFRKSITFLLTPIYNLIHLKTYPLVNKLILLFKENKAILLEEAKLLDILKAPDFSLLEYPLKNKGKLYSNFVDCFLYLHFQMRNSDCLTNIYHSLDGFKKLFKNDFFCLRSKKASFVNNLIITFKNAFKIRNVNNTNLYFNFERINGDVLKEESKRKEIDKLVELVFREVNFNLKQNVSLKFYHRPENEIIHLEDKDTESTIFSKKNTRTNTIIKEFTLSKQFRFAGREGLLSNESISTHFSILAEDLLVWYFEDFNVDKKNFQNCVPESYFPVREGVSQESLVDLAANSIVIGVKVPSRDEVYSCDLTSEEKQRQSLMMEELVYLVTVLNSNNCMNPQDSSSIKSNKGSSKFNLSFSFINYCSETFLLINVIREGYVNNNRAEKETPLQFFRYVKSRITQAISQEKTIKESMEILKTIYQFELDGDSALINKRDQQISITRFFKNNYNQCFIDICLAVESRFYDGKGEEKIKNFLDTVEWLIVQNVSFPASNERVV